MGTTQTEAQTEILPDAARPRNSLDFEAPPPPKPVTLRVPRDFTLATRALENEAAELEKLAKKNTEAGYFRESRAIAGDAYAITHEILPQFRAQQELPLAGPEEVRSAVANALRDVIKYAHQTKQDPETTLGQIARRVDTYVRDVAEHAFTAGYAAREFEPAVLAVRSVHKLADRPEDEE